MRQDVANAVEELRRKFPTSTITVEDDGGGGAKVFVEQVELGPRFVPSSTWLGAQIPALYPYADIYPVFMGAEVQRADGRDLQVPVTAGANFGGRPAWQISRRTHLAQQYGQPAYSKFLKVIDFLRTLP